MGEQPTHNIKRTDKAPINCQVNLNSNIKTSLNFV